MYKKHNYLDRLRYMALLEDGYSTHYVHKKFGIDKEQLIVLKMLYDQGGIDALRADGRGRHRKNMGRPRKKKPEDMTELELLQLRVKELEAENALLKKVKALVEAREARLKEIGRKPSKN